MKELMIMRSRIQVELLDPVFEDKGPFDVGWKATADAYMEVLRMIHEEIMVCITERQRPVF